MHTVRRRGVLTAFGTALTAAPVLAACGAGDSSANGSTDEVIRLGYFGNITHAPALVGIQNHIFDETVGEDVNIETTVFNAGPEAIEALFADAIDISYIGPNPAINGWAQSQGQALHVIAGACSGGAALAVNDDVIGSVEELEGKRIATPQLANTQDVAARHFLLEQGFETDESGGGDVSVIPTPNSELTDVYSTGAVDGAWAVEPHLSRIVVEHGATVLVDERELWEGGEFVTTHVIVATKFLDSRPDLVKAFLEGHLAALDYIAEHPEEAQLAANDHLEALSGNRLSDEVVDAAFANLTFTADPIADSLAGSAVHAAELGFIEEVDLRGIYRLDHVNEILAERGEAQISAGDLV